MKPRPRTARPGDVCLLLEPAKEEIAQLRQRQRTLQARFGGRPHQRIHLTFQRFEPADTSLWPQIGRNLRASLSAISPVPLVAVSLVQLEPPFWGIRQLRWRVRGSDALQKLGRLTENSLVSAGVTPHFRCGEGWNPTAVTALDEVPELDLEAHLADLPFPQPLFTGRWVVVSKILGRGRFEIVDTIELVDE